MLDHLVTNPGLSSVALLTLTIQSERKHFQALLRSFGYLARVRSGYLDRRKFLTDDNQVINIAHKVFGSIYAGVAPADQEIRLRSSVLEDRGSVHGVVECKSLLSIIDLSEHRERALVLLQ